jgi:hypothetical protein
MNNNTLFDPYSLHPSAGWRDWACWVPGRNHEDLLHHALAPVSPVPTDETAMMASAASGTDEAPQPVRV